MPPVHVCFGHSASMDIILAAVKIMHLRITSFSHFEVFLTGSSDIELEMGLPRWTRVLFLEAACSL